MKVSKSKLITTCVIFLLIIIYSLDAHAESLGQRAIAAPSHFYLQGEFANDFLKSLDSDQKHWLLDNQVIYVGVIKSTPPPFSIIRQDGTFEGMAADLLSIFSKITNIEVKIIYFNNIEEAIKALSEKKIHMLSLYSISQSAHDELKSIGQFSLDVSLSQKAYLIGNGSIIENISRTPIVTFDEGSYTTESVRMLFPNIDIKPSPSAEEAYESLLFGNVDYMIGHRLVIRYLNGVYFSRLPILQKIDLDNKPVSFFVSDSNPHLLKIINSFISSFQRFGLYGMLDLRWRGGAGTDYFELKSIISPNAYKSLMDRTIRVGLVKNNMPFSFIDERGVWRGVIIDILDHIAFKTNLKFAYIGYSSFDSTENALLNSDVDLIGSIPLHSTRTDTLTSLYFNADDMLVTIIADKEKKEYKTDRIAISESNYKFINSYLIHDINIDNLIPYGTDQDVIRAFEAGRFNKAVVSIYAAKYYQEQSSRPYRIIGRSSRKNIERAFAARQDDAYLIKLIDNALSSTMPSHLSQISYQWRYGPHPRVDLLDEYGHIIIPIMLFAALYGYYSYRLAKALNRKKDAEEKLTSQLNMMKHFLDGIPHPVALLSNDCTILYSNVAFRNEFGRNVETFIGDQLSRHISDHQSYLSVRNKVKDVIKHSLVCSSEGEIVINGIRKDIEEWFIPYNRENKNSVYWGWFDVTWRNEKYNSALLTQSLAEKENKAKSDFIAMISHEIRTPINIIGGFLELYRRKKTLTEDEIIYIDQAINSLLSIVGNVLDITKIESGLLSLECKHVNISKLIRDTADSFKPIVSQKSIELSCEIKIDSSCSLYLDSVRISQILYNLIGNAVKFTEHGCVCITADYCNGSLNIIVQDSGIGIPEHKINNLFKPFTRAHSDFKYQGTGLGLSLCKQLCDLMGGGISLESKMNVGTTVALSIPCSATKNKDIISESILNNNDDYKINQNAINFTVLIVDDHPVNLYLLSKQLELIGLRVIKASSAKRAIKILKKQHIDAVLTDCQMDDVSGYALTKMIRTYEERLHTKKHIIIGITASGLKKDKDDGLNAGMDDFIFRPVDSNGLTNVFSRFISGKWLNNAITNSNKNSTANNLVKNREFESLLLENTKSDLISAFTYLDRNDVKKLSSAVHRVKGVYMMLNNHQIVSLCQEVEIECEKTGAVDKHAIEIKLKALKSLFENHY